MFFITAEIYNETVIDLLIPNARLPNLREDSLKGRILVEGAFEPKVESLKEVVHLLGPITNLFAWVGGVYTVLLSKRRAPAAPLRRATSRNSSPKTNTQHHHCMHHRT